MSHQSYNPIPDAVAQRDAHFREIKRAQKIIDALRLYREGLITCPLDSTPEMRARIKELAMPPRDDFDRAVLTLLGDFDRLHSRSSVGHDG